ncbi:hypothetical protein NXS19_001752 [Fusarium pseudograminearum]|nr:hypothetical protein NXS19_001752 [Fusarium pseudograminearum]
MLKHRGFNGMKVASSRDVVCISYGEENKRATDIQSLIIAHTEERKTTKRQTEWRAEHRLESVRTPEHNDGSLGM